MALVRPAYSLLFASEVFGRSSGLLMLLSLLLLPKRPAYGPGEAHQVVHIELDRLVSSKVILLCQNPLRCAQC